MCFVSPCSRNNVLALVEHMLGAKRMKCASDRVDDEPQITLELNAIARVAQYATNSRSRTALSAASCQDANRVATRASTLESRRLFLRSRVRGGEAAEREMATSTEKGDEDDPEVESSVAAYSGRPRRALVEGNGRFKSKAISFWNNLRNGMSNG